MKKQVSLNAQQRVQRNLTCSLLVLIILVACKSAPPPEKPVITPSGAEIKIAPGERETISASSTGASRYKWSLQGDGGISASTGPNIFYTAPNAGGGLAILTVTAYNNQGDSSQNALTINIATIDSVRLERLAIPAGWMCVEGKNPANFIRFESSPNRCFSGADCKRITYRSGAVWGGIYWWPLSCGESGTTQAWARVQQATCGVNLPQMTNLSSIIQLTFWARGERGEEVIEFKIGGADVSPIPGNSTGKVTLSADWRQYQIDLSNMNLTNAVGLFAWIASDMDNPQGATFYLDDIQFKGIR